MAVGSACARPAPARATHSAPTATERPGSLLVLARVLAAGVLSRPVGTASASCQHCNQEERPWSARPAAPPTGPAGTITYLTGFGWQASVGILDPIAAEALGYYSAMCLRVQLRPGNGDPTSSSQLVAAGRATVTELGSPSDAITAAAGGIPIDAVATYGNTTASTLLTMPSVTNLRQLDGKTIGYKGAMPPIITAMLEKAGVNLHSVKEVSVGYDPTILPRGQVQALTAYKSNEPIQLKDDGYKFHEWDPGSFGLNGAFNVFDANRTWANAHPGAMEDFLRATFEAYHYCLSHASTCVQEAARYQAGLPRPPKHPALAARNRRGRRHVASRATASATRTRPNGSPSTSSSWPTISSNTPVLAGQDHQPDLHRRHLPWRLADLARTVEPADFRIRPLGARPANVCGVVACHKPVGQDGALRVAMRLVMALVSLAAVIAFTTRPSRRFRRSPRLRPGQPAAACPRRSPTKPCWCTS